MSENKIFSPEFIPFYVKEVRKYKLSPTEGLVYGFIRFYTKLKNNWFYFKSKDLGEIIQVSSWTVDNCILRLKNKGLILAETEQKGFKKIRKIYLNFDAILDTNKTIKKEIEIAWEYKNEKQNTISSNDEVPSHQMMRADLIEWWDKIRIYKENNINNISLQKFSKENYKINQTAYLLKCFFNLWYKASKNETIESFRKWFKEKILDYYDFWDSKTFEIFVNNFETYWIDKIWKNENKNWKSTFSNSPLLNNYKRKC